MRSLEENAGRFLARQQEEAAEARQLAALSLSCGIDLHTALATAPEARRSLILKLERAIERERLKGLRRHWSYDLNRHIALKQALDRIEAAWGHALPAATPDRFRARTGKTNGARRRRP